MTLHAITWLDTPHITWFVAMAEATYGGHAIPVPMWATVHIKTPSGYIRHVALPEPRHLN